MFRFGFADPKAEPAEPAAPSEVPGEAADHIGAEEVQYSEVRTMGMQAVVTGPPPPLPAAYLDRW